MIEMYKYYAKCNQVVNSKMIDIIENLDFNAYQYKIDGYFKDIAEVLTHCYIGDMSWISSFRTIKEYSIYKHPLFESIPKFGDKLFENVGEYKEYRMKLDQITIDLINEVEKEDLYKIGTRVNRLGEKKEHVFWKALMHMFNHQTHHRGQVSQILDQLKIENDFSNIILIE